MSITVDEKIKYMKHVCTNLTKPEKKELENFIDYAHEMFAEPGQTLKVKDVKILCNQFFSEFYEKGDSVKEYQGDIPNPKSLNVTVITWNMGENKNTEEGWTNELSSDWDIIIDKEYDILFVTLQEDQSQGNFGKAIKNNLAKKYDVYEEKTIPRLPGAKFAVKAYVFVKNNLKPLITLKTTKVCLTKACTKSTVGISLTLNNKQQLIFMGSHLPINTKKDDLGYDERRAAVNKSLQKVFDELRNPSLPYGAFWAGDLNFRLMDGTDQLKKSQTSGDFRGFREQKIDFPPTCKMEIEKRDCDRVKSDTNRLPECYVYKRAPSYCDRILYDYSSSGNIDIIPLKYQSYGDAKSIQKSDHNLLYGKFKIRM